MSVTTAIKALSLGEKGLSDPSKLNWRKVNVHAGSKTHGSGMEFGNEMAVQLYRRLS
jgi:hypothetical protein